MPNARLVLAFRAIRARTESTAVANPAIFLKKRVRLLIVETCITQVFV
jgi:hypothetical protein